MTGFSRLTVSIQENCPPSNRGGPGNVRNQAVPYMHNIVRCVMLMGKPD